VKFSIFRREVDSPIHGAALHPGVLGSDHFPKPPGPVELQLLLMMGLDCKISASITYRFRRWRPPARDICSMVASGVAFRALYVGSSSPWPGHARRFRPDSKKASHCASPVLSVWRGNRGTVPSCHSVENPSGSPKSCYTPRRSKIPKILIWVCGHGAGAEALYQGSASNCLILLVKPA
jgi:hypothetical protein